MKQTTAFIMFILVSTWMSAQIKTGMRKLKIADTGVVALFWSAADSISVSTDQDGTKTWSLKARENECSYHLLLMQAQAQPDMGRTQQDDYLQKKLMEIKARLGIAKSEAMQQVRSVDKDPELRQFTDFWYNSSDYRYAVQIWMTENYFAVLTVGKQKQLPSYAQCNEFFKGIAFPL